MSYCLKRRKNTESKAQGLQRQINKSQCFYQNVGCVIVNKSRFIKQQEANEKLSSLGLNVTLSKLPVLGYVMFRRLIKLMK